jgi:hypothetical protein
VNEEALNGLDDTLKLLGQEERTAPLLALTVLGVMMKRELASHSDMDNRTFGWAYELMYFNGSSFEYLSDITYLAVLAEIELQDERVTTPKYSLIHPRVKVRSTPQLTEVTHLMTISEKNTITFLIRPPGLNNQESKELTQLEVERAKVLERNPPTQISQFYCIMILLK